MNATLIDFIYLLSLVCWIGSIIFFSFFVAPIVFETLESKKTGELVGVIFPYYYMVGTASAGLAVNPKAKTLKKRLKASSEAEKPALEARFKVLHSLSVKLNGMVLLVGIWLLWLSATKTLV